MKLKKVGIKISIAITLLLTLVISVGAEKPPYYNGQMTPGIYNKQYYNSLSNTNLAKQVDAAIADWNYAVNSSDKRYSRGFLFYKIIS